MTFSPRQRQIIVAIGRDGLTWDAAARSLGISVSTVQCHVARIREKVGDGRPPRDLMVRLYYTEVDPSVNPPTG